MNDSLDKLYREESRRVFSTLVRLLVTFVRSHTISRMTLETIRIYSEVEKKLGSSVGLKQVGQLRVANTDQQTFGLEALESMRLEKSYRAINRECSHLIGIEYRRLTAMCHRILVAH